MSITGKIVANITGKIVVDITDTPQGGSPYGPELVTNGGFDTDSDWTKETGWTISGGVASFANPTGTTLKQAGNYPANTAWLVEFDLDISSGTIIQSLSGGGIDNGPAQDTSGRKSVVIVTTGARTHLQFTGAGTSVFTIDNVSVREVL